MTSPVVKAAVAAALCVAATSSFAADMALKAPPPAPIVAPPSWTGFYLGAHVGYGWGDAEVTLRPGPWFPGQPAWLTANGSPTLNTSGALGGFQAGYNSKIGNWVLGVEADFSFADINGSRSTGLLTPPPALALANRSFAESDHLDWLATFRGRVGYSVQNLLVYATGGLALGQRDYSQSILTDPALNFNNIRGSVTQTKTGWTVGGGLEYALTRNWSVKAEYLYVDLGSIGFFADVDTAPGFGLTVDSSSKLTLHTARAGVNYRFDWGAPVVAKY